MEHQKLEEENKRLKEKLSAIENAKKEKWSKRLILSKKFSGFFLGKKLKSAITDFFNELEQKRSVSKNTVADLLSAMFMRVTRIGAYLIITSLLPTLFLLFQLYYLRSQNELISTQNNRLEQQTYLQEADRRSYMTGVLDGIIKDVTKEGYRNSGKITKVNSNRLIAISKILKPYKYLENDVLIEKPLSPERGYLLLSLLESNLELGVIIDNNTQESLLSQLNFTYAELNNASLTGLEIYNINLDNSSLKASNFTKSTFIRSSFANANLSNTIFLKSDVMNCSFENSNLESVSFKDSTLNNVKFENANLKNANFSNCDIININLRNATVIGAKFDNAIVKPNWIENQKIILDRNNYNYLTDNYRIKTQNKRSILIAK